MVMTPMMEDVMGKVRRAVLAADNSQPVYAVQTMETVWRRMSRNGASHCC